MTKRRRTEKRRSHKAFIRQVPYNWNPLWACGVYAPLSENPHEPIALFAYSDQARMFVYHHAPDWEVRLLVNGKSMAVTKADFKTG